MTKPTVIIHNAETNEIETREMNAVEFKQWEEDQALFAAQIVADADKEAARQALLARIGITSDEAALLLG
jgi:hypothetical protein